ncbi:hypothetical protein BAE44_0020393 [Dichanthelium oligosanthes]|uniref:GATA-type domain-containing protein n=1 Tax=Dichanthelium oligosanthes TaxID=888268 RepID=A0A1E5V0D9_9POAL|nr:hypothetical protein BAE44_0020393 [Dichanthelium oligosanthes]
MSGGHCNNMHELSFLYLSPHDFPDVADCDGSCGLVDGGGPCTLHAGLCCPDDSLDTVLENPHVLAAIDKPHVFTEELLYDLEIAASLPPRHELLPTGRGKEVSESEDSSWTATSSLETKSSLPPPPPPVLRLVVPRRKRDRSVKRGRRLWSLGMPSLPARHGGNNPNSGSDGKDGGRRNVDGGGVRRRLLGPPRPRNRQTRRACSHCDSTETPQWRAGPDGPGTLCNACGIRYAMNKLLPEYRPSTSPSFRSDKHSNRHRKVVKLREKKVNEKIVDMPPAPPDSGEFMDFCKCISTGQ